MKKLIPFLLALMVVLAVPVASVEAQVGGFVPCEGDECGTCHFIAMGNSIINWLIVMLFLVFAVLMVVAGFGLVTSGGNQSALDAAKSKFQNALVGIILVLAAWLIVDTLLRGILDGGTGNVLGYGPWSQVQCTSQSVPREWDGDPQSANAPASVPPVTTTAPGGAATPVTTPPATCTGGNCAAMGIPCSNSNSCSISPDLVDNFQAFHQAAGVNGARVTEAMPPTRNHRSACHSNGTCIDYSRQGGMTAAEVQRVIVAAQANGLRPVYEVQTAAQRDALVAGGVSGSNVVVLGSWISAPHFSIYGY